MTVEIGRKLFAAMSVLVLASCEAPVNVDVAEADAMPTINVERIKNDMLFLADDTLKGRDSDSAGYQIAANYMATQFANLGLKPGGDNGSYKQEVGFRYTKLVEGSAGGTLQIGDETIALELGKDIAIGSSSFETETAVLGDLVFAGYGIHAPSLGHDDYADIDVDGKIVIVMSGGPDSFASDVAAAFNRSSTKAEMAGARGAIALISLSSTASEERFPMERLQRFFGRQALRWMGPDGSIPNNVGSIKATATLSADIAAKLGEAVGIDFGAFSDLASEGVAPKPTAINATLSLQRETEMLPGFTSPNVVAVLPGSDPVLKDEYVLISAHLDHVGVNEDAEGDDKIYNGAMDNASGNAVMLEVARAYTESGETPRRSIMFISLTAEEKGLMGADYFAHFPTVPLAKIVANVNLDMPILLYDFKDVVAFGAEHSSIEGTARRAVEKAGIMLAEDPVPEQGLFTRSDHFRFVQKGIPAIFLMTGHTAVDPEVDGGAIWSGFLTGNETQQRNYHRPSDDMSQAFDWAAASKFALVNYLIIDEIANEDSVPSWNADSIFGQYYGKK